MPEAEVRPAAETALLAAVLAGAPDAVIGIDATGTITAWNDASTALLGWSAEEAIGAPLAELVVPPEMRDAHLAGLARVRDGGPSRLAGRTVPLLAQRRDGERLPVELTITALETPEGRRFHAFLRDASPRLHRDVRLRELEARFARYAELLPGVALELRGAGGEYRCTFVSDGWTTALDADPTGEADPMPALAALGVPAHLAAGESDLRLVDVPLAGGRRLRAQPRRRDGEVLWEALVLL